MKNLVYLIVLSYALFSCEKTIDIRTKSQQAQMVVDGNIETNQYPIIFLSNSLDFFNNITPQILNNSLVRNAIVTITDGEKTNRLKEYTIALANGFSISFYSTDSITSPNAIRGQNGKRYQLNIEANGVKYQASTAIPLPAKRVDSIWWKNAIAEKDSNRVVLMSRISDPPGFGNYIRYFTKVGRGEFLPGATSVFDDQVVDGTTYDIQVDKGINRNDLPDFEDFGFFNKGDTITVKFANIDKATFDFWRTIEYSYQSIGNPFSTPTTVLGNVKGGLGAFCGYSVQVSSLIVPR